MKYYIATVDYWIDGSDKTVIYRHLVAGESYTEAMREMLDTCYNDTDIRSIKLQEISCEGGPLLINRRIAEDILEWQNNINCEDGESA